MGSDDRSDFIEEQGPAFMAHLLRRLYDDFVRAIAQWYPEIGVRAPPRTHSTMLALHQRGPLALTEIAELLRQSHPLVLTWVRQLKALGFVEAEADPNDGRRTILRLTAAGRREFESHERSDRLVAAAFERLMKEADAEIFEGLWRIEKACRETPFIDRLREASAASSEF